MSLLNKYDKITHFIVGFIFSLIGDFNLATTVFVGKEIYDCYKKNPTGFDLTDLACDYGGWCFGKFIKEWMKI